jgi:hypothetical protein
MPSPCATDHQTDEHLTKACSATNPEGLAGFREQAGSDLMNIFHDVCVVRRARAGRAVSGVKGHGHTPDVSYAGQDLRNVWMEQ